MEFIKDDKKLQKLTTALEDEIRVKSLKPAEWIEVENYLAEYNLENPTKLALISKAKLSPSRLSEKECQSLFTVLQQYESFYRNKV